MPIMVIRDMKSLHYLASFDPDAHDPGTTYPTGNAIWSRYLKDAMTFGHAGEAINFYKTQSTVTPLRPDGKPNRPLTVFSVSIDPLDKCEDEVDVTTVENSP